MWGTMHQSARGCVPKLCSIVRVFAAIPILLACSAAAQSINDVHVTPAPEKALRTLAPERMAPANHTSALPLRPRPLRRDVELVLVPVTVTDPYDRLVTGLEAHDFSLREGEKPQQIRYFSSEEAPISLGVILDVSASMKDKMDDAREAVVRFFENANPDDDYFVITFSDYPQVLADSTRSIAYIRERLATAEPHGYTALLDAIYLGINKLQHARYGRRALLVISDGGDNVSRYRERELKKLVEESDVEIYSIGIYSRWLTMLLTPEERHGKQLLANISDVTGGRMIELHHSRELPEIARQVSLELRSQYVLGYHPPDSRRDGKWRAIKVSLASAERKGRLRVYFKKGYLGPAE